MISTDRRIVPMTLFRTCRMAAPAGGKQKHAVGINRNPPEPHICYGGLSQPATQNTNTWLCQPVAHKREIKSMEWIDGRLDGYADGSMEMDRVD